MKKILLFITLLFVVINCTRKKSFIGHWHELKGISNEFGECIIINDSTFSISKYTQGGDFGEYKDLKDILNRTYYDSLIFQNYSIEKRKIIINDSIKWIKQKKNTQTFINDFSARLKIKIIPFIKSYSYSDTIKNFKKNLNYLIFIGKPKEKFISKTIERNKLYFQLNDRLTKEKSNLMNFLLCNHCDVNDYNYIIIPDESITKSYMNTVYNTIELINIKKSNVYFQYVDTTLNKLGYKNINDFEQLLK